MPVFEHAHVFQVVMSALKPLRVNTCLILNAIGTQLNCSAIVDGLMFDWQSLFDSVWYDFRNLSIITFHDSDDAEIKTTTTAGNAAILLPVQDGTKALCCQKDVRVVRVMGNVNFSGLITIPNYGPTVLCIGFYLELPQTTIAMMDGHYIAYNLTTWHGVADLTTLTSNEVCMLILEPCLQDGPIALCPANYNLGNANIDAVTVCETIHAKILCLGFKQICASIFAQLYPGYSDQPHAVLEHICQTSTGFDGQPVTATVIEYSQRMLNAARPFATQARYAISICNHFIQGLDKTLLTSFQKMYPYHSTVHDLLGSYQRHMLPIILAAAQAAKDECKQFQDIERGMLASQGFFASTPSGASVHASQAEQTLRKYKDHVPIKRICWGCGEDHSWMTKGKINCPRSKDPQVIQKLESSFANYNAALKRGGSSKSKADGGKKTGKRTIKFKDLNKRSQKKMRETILATSADIGSTAS
jgi:hypothetical protein